MLIELYYQRKSKVLYIFLAISILLTIGMFISQISLVNSNLGDIKYLSEQALQNGEDIKEILASDFSVSSIDNGEIINNPLKYYYMSYQASLAAMLPVNGVNQLLSSSFFILFPFVCGIYGVILANADIKYRTLNLRRSRSSQWKINRNKLIAGIVSIFSFLVTSILVFMCLQFLSKFIIEPNSMLYINMEVIKKILYLSQAPIQILTVMGASITYFIICFYLTFVTRNVLVGIILLLIYNLFLPILGVYDLKNILLYVYDKIFNTNATIFYANAAIDVSLNIWVIVVGFLILGSYIFFMEKIHEKFVSVEKE